MNKKSIEQEAEEYVIKDGWHSEGKMFKHLKAAYIAAATKYSEQQRQVIADTWEAALRSTLKIMAGAIHIGVEKQIDLNTAKREYLNNLFPSEIKDKI